MEQEFKEILAQYCPKTADELTDDYNKDQPSYRQVVGLVVRENPFVKTATRKIKRTEVLIDEPAE